MTTKSDLDTIIEQVKQEFKNLLIKRRELITRLGNAFESVVSNSESVCEEIKNSLQEEIADKIISARDIERYCPDKWKKKTKPKNDKLSFSKPVEEKPLQKIAVTQGNKSVGVTCRSTINTDKYDKQPKDNDQWDHQSNQKQNPAGTELGPELGARVLRDETQSINGERNSSEESEGSEGNAKQDVFDCYVPIPFEHLRKDLEAVFRKTKGIGNVWFCVTVNLGTNSVTFEFCGSMQEKSNAMITKGEGRMKISGTEWHI